MRALTSAAKFFNSAHQTLMFYESELSCILHTGIAQVLELDIYNVHMDKIITAFPGL
jgi:hypothetical protein